MCKDSGDSQAELAKMPLDNHKQCFDTAAEVLRFYGSCGTKVLGTQPLIQKNLIIRWKFLNNVILILEQGVDLLDGYDVDDKVRTPYVIGDSCVTFNKDNKTPLHNGAGMAKAYAERVHLWRGKTLQVIVLTQDAAKQEHILSLLKTFIASFSPDMNPEEFLGNLLLIFSPNDVRKGNKEVHPDKLIPTREICALLRRFPLGTVSIVGPGSEANFGFGKGDFSHLAEVYMQEYIECGHPVFNPEFIYETMEPHYWRSAVREAGKQLTNPDGSYMWSYAQDMPFLIVPRIMTSFALRSLRLQA